VDEHPKSVLPFMLLDLVFLTLIWVHAYLHLWLKGCTNDAETHHALPVRTGLMLPSVAIPGGMLAYAHPLIHLVRDTPLHVPGMRVG
jgi:hypothetical protein